MVPRMFPIFLTLVTLVSLACAPSSVMAQPPKIEADGPSVFSKLNPLNWSAPKMPSIKFPTVSQKKKVTKSKQPGFWSSVGTSTRSAWDKTTDFLNPFDDKPKKKKKSESFLSKLTKPAEEPRPISTVGDFLQQKHPY
ncbi:hypothetical protein [Rosistilla oblonga]|uniref:Uncharacterized protein n=1 Tax=Rosistilla oblonga TaxID=2527990 RepID=A0A518J1D7_9BACT|nr:hypothetical protein [Rosistilla oblonga]QDV59160.1 hypothetical protein Mal33_51880 [Rosistilla oblonga]